MSDKPNHLDELVEQDRTIAELREENARLREKYAAVHRESRERGSRLDAVLERLRELQTDLALGPMHRQVTAHDVLMRVRAAIEAGEGKGDWT